MSDRPSSRRPLGAQQIIKGLLLLFGLLAAFLLVESVDLQALLRPERIAGFLHSLGPWAPFALILAMTTAVVISPIPSLPLDLAAGAVYGPFLGTTFVVIGAEIGAILSFLIGRALGREVISRLLGVNVVFCEKCSNHHLGVMIFLARLLPVFSFDVISYGAGLTTLLGMIRPAFAITYLGSSVVSAQWALIVSGCVLVAFFLLMPRLVKRYRSSWLAQLMFGPAPVALTASPVQVVPALATSGEVPCPGCGGPTGMRKFSSKPLPRAESAASGYQAQRLLSAVKRVL